MANERSSTWLAADASLVSLAMALGLSAWEASQLAGPEVPFLEAWRATAAAFVAVAIVVAPFVFLTAHLARRILRRLLIGDDASILATWQRHAPVVLTAGSVAFAAAFVAALSVAFVDRFFGSTTVQIIVLGALQFGVVFIGVVAFPVMRSTARRAVDAAEESVGPGSSLALVAATGLGGVIAFVIAAWEILEQMELRSHLAGLTIAVGALAGLALPQLFRTSPRRMVPVTVAVRVASGLATAVVVLLGGMFVAFETPKSVRLALRQKPTTTRAVLDLIAARRVARDFASRPAEGSKQSPTCRPDASPPTLSQLGEISEDAPDIILVTVDALRWDHTSLSGYERDTTPRLARHADAAAVFEAYTPASSTRQTFRSLFTGLYPAQVAAPPSTKWGLSFADAQLTLAEFLRSVGYSTVVVSSEDSIFPVDRDALPGFEVVDESPIEQKLEHGFSAPSKVDRIIAHMSDPDLDGPRFVWTHLMEPHQPYPAGPDPIDFGDDEVDEYDAAIRFADAELDRLIDFVRSPSRRDSTWLIVTADHGQAFGEHGNRFHGSTVYQEEIHVPLVVWGPEVEPSRQPTAVSLVDVTPTIIELAGLSIPTGLCGESLEPVLGGAKLDPRPIYVEQIPDATRTYFGVAFLRGTDKLIVRPAHDVIELYDLAADPGETEDLSDDGERVGSHLEALRSFYEERGMNPDDYGL